MADNLGAQLASARRKAGRSLSEAESATRIRAKMLEALEREDWELLPNAAYVRGYIISYAKFLEIDPAPLLKLYSEETGHKTTREQFRAPDPVVPTRDRAHHIPWGTAAAIAGAVVFVVLVIWLIGRFTGEQDKLQPLPNVPETSSTTPAGGVTETPGATTSTVPAVEQSETTPAAAGEPFTLKVKVASDGASWLRVTVDGLKAYEGTLAGGQSKEWDVQEEAVVRVGKPSSVSVYRNGEQLEIPSAAETPQMTITSTDPAPASTEQ